MAGRKRKTKKTTTRESIFTRIVLYWYRVERDDPKAVFKDVWGFLRGETFREDVGLVRDMLPGNLITFLHLLLLSPSHHFYNYFCHRKKLCGRLPSRHVCLRLGLFYLSAFFHSSRCLCCLYFLAYNVYGGFLSPISLSSHPTSCACVYYFCESETIFLGFQ